MATMVKEKRKEKKKKPKEKVSQKMSHEAEAELSNSYEALVSQRPSLEKLENDEHLDKDKTKSKPSMENLMMSTYHDDTKTKLEVLLTEPEVIGNDCNLVTHTKRLAQESICVPESLSTYKCSTSDTKEDITNFGTLSTQLENIDISYETTSSTILSPSELESSPEHLTVDAEDFQQGTLEQPVPSAPVFDEVPTVQEQEAAPVVITRASEPVVQCMSLEEAVRVFGGEVIMEVMAISDKEEAIVEVGPTCGSDHPLVDLLCTFRCSLNAVERERTDLARGFVEEEKYRGSLWSIEKRKVNLSEKCRCGATVELRASYEHAELIKSMLPVAKMKLESLSREVQHSYCHHQHEALLAHCQIEQLIAETVQSNKKAIREALSLVLVELRKSEGSQTALSAALQRWTEALVTALLASRDWRHLLFVIHHMFRQTRSVRYLARLVDLHAGDSVDVARAVALLDIVLQGVRVDRAAECTEESDEVWEEIDKHGGGGAVSDGSLRERDLLALFRSFPLNDMIARLALFRNRDIADSAETSWRDLSGGAGTLKGCVGARALLGVLGRCVRAHPSYRRLARALCDAAERAARAVLYVCQRNSAHFSVSLAPVIQAECSALFAQSLSLFAEARGDLRRLPFPLLSQHAASLHCQAFIERLHETSTQPTDGSTVSIPDWLSCAQRVQVVASMACQREDDSELATTVLQALLQTGLSRKAPACKGGCAATARDTLSAVLTAHPYLYLQAFHSLAEMFQAGNIDASLVRLLAVERWRPAAEHAILVLDDWAQRCPTLLPALLMATDCTPHTGLCLPTQLAIADWLLSYHSGPGEAPDWLWRALRHLSTHAVYWRSSPHSDASDKSGLFADAHALATSTEGYCMPLICEFGVARLCRLAAAGRYRDAVHYLAPIMIVMSQSPESISFTPKFNEVLSLIVKSGPSLVARALGRGGESGCALLLKLMVTQLTHTAPQLQIPQSALLSTWLHALCPLPAAHGLLEIALLSCREWQAVDRHVVEIIQDENSKELVSSVLRSAGAAPSLAESCLRAQLAAETRAGTWPRVLHALHAQRQANMRIHATNALKLIGSSLSPDELAIHRAAAAAMTAPLSNPSHLTLWRLFLHMYLERPPGDTSDSTPPIGPLFFSGLTKSRTLGYLKKHLSDTATFHHNEANKLKQLNDNIAAASATKNQAQEAKVTSADDLLPPLLLVDLTGEEVSSDSESTGTESGSENAEEKDDKSPNVTSGTEKERLTLLCYHEAAEKLTKTYLGWLECGDKVRATPQHADITRFLSEQALEAAWRQEVARCTPAASPDDEELSPFPPLPRAAPAPPASPFQRVLALLTTKRHRRRRRRLSELRPPVEGVPRDPRGQLAALDRSLREIELLARDWCAEVERLSSLDNALWPLVSALRVARPIPQVKMSCTKNCMPIPFVVPGQEWCISAGSENGIKENRCSARATLRRLARARPHAARTAAALRTIARRVNSLESAVAVLERAWKCSCNSDVERCAPAKLVLTAVVTDLAERWMSGSVPRSCQLLSRWLGGSGSPSASLRLALAGALVAPRASSSPAEWAHLYTTLLHCAAPPQDKFSYLSKFEVGRWSQVASAAERRDLIEALIAAVESYGPRPGDRYKILLEQIGIHLTLATTGQEVGHVVARCARASAAARVAPTHWTHVQRAVDAYSEQLTRDRLGNLLRELGVIWWEARSQFNAERAVHYAAYATHFARLLKTLTRAFTHAAATERGDGESVAWSSWSALQEGWSPWVAPQPGAALLLPACSDDNSFMLQQHRVEICALLDMCSGSEPFILQQVWEWSAHLFATVAPPRASQDERIQLSCLLEQLRKLPWERHQWLSARCMHSFVQVCSSKDAEATSFLCRALQASPAGGWMRGVPDDRATPHLATLLYLFTTLPLDQQTLEEAALLPWWRLPVEALNPALERYLAEHHDISTPYHALPHFSVILYASELVVHPSHAHLTRRASAAEKRLCSVSHWVRASTAPPLVAHVPAATAALLDAVTTIGKVVVPEMEGLLARAVTALCTEPAAAAALPEWVRWLSSAPYAAVSAALAAVCTLTTFEYFAPLADAAAQAAMLSNEAAGWSPVTAALSQCHWRRTLPLLQRGQLHAAYAVARACERDLDDVRAALVALTTQTVNFIDREVILAVWACFACRVALQSATVAPSAGESERGAAAARLLADWARGEALSLRAMFVACSDRPTHRIRLLCRFALCVLTPDSEPLVRSYESSCAAVLGSSPGDAAAWAHAPHPRRLPRLAMRLYPKFEKYFEQEFNLAPEENA